MCIILLFCCNKTSTGFTSITLTDSFPILSFFSAKMIQVKNRIFLAPMYKVNDIAFRILCKKAGSGLNYTGMINPLSKQRIDLDDKPAIQIFCNKELGIREFIKKHEKQASLF